MEYLDYNKLIYCTTSVGSATSGATSAGLFASFATFLSNKEKESYDILMMMTEKSIGGKNFNIFLKTLFDKLKAKFPDKSIRLGEYAYQEDGDKIELIYIRKYAYFKDNTFILEDMSDSNTKQTFQITQLNGIDIVDRIESAWNEISKLN